MKHYVYKMSSSRSLHILNGTAMSDRFNQTGIEGNYVSWNEAMIEGPLNYSIEDDFFWEERKDYFINQGVKEFPSPFHDKLLQLSQSSPKIFCWFEYDLFCQINMMAALAFLSKNNYGGNIYLVQIGPAELGSYYTFGSASLDQWSTCFKSAKWITSKDILFVNWIWKLVSSTDLRDLNQLDQLEIPGNFHYLKKALELIKFLFPNQISKLNIVESTFLANRNKFKNPDSKYVISLLLKKMHLYGFGDSQIEKIIADLNLSDNIENSQDRLILQNVLRTKSFSNFNWADFTYNEKLNTILTNELL